MLFILFIMAAVLYTGYLYWSCPLSALTKRCMWLLTELEVMWKEKKQTKPMANKDSENNACRPALQRYRAIYQQYNSLLSKVGNSKAPILALVWTDMEVFCNLPCVQRCTTAELQFHFLVSVFALPSVSAPLFCFLLLLQHHLGFLLFHILKKES